MVIKETWRLHPPAPLLVPREVMSEFEINGYKIQSKTLLYVNAWAIGRDPDTWKDPEVFLPERFVDNNIDAKGQNFELLPFGSGRRMCPGMYMGTTMVEFGLANMLSQFDWKLPEGMVVEDMDMEESPGLTVGKKKELLLVPQLEAGASHYDLQGTLSLIENQYHSWLDDNETTQATQKRKNIVYDDDNEIMVH